MTLFTAPGSILIAILAAAPGQAGTAGDGLAGTAWRAVELAGTAVAAQPAPQREPHLVFGADGRVSGADGCNRLTGPYAVTGEAVTFGNLAGTMMACPGTDEIAQRFRSALKGTSHWRIEDGRLKFYGAAGQPLAVFERREAAPAGAASPLEGTTWQLVTFRGGDDRTLTPDDRAKYTLEFAAGGRLAARLDCNRGRATWSTDGAALTLGPLATTRAKCPAGSLHDQIVKQWASIRSYVVKDGHLFLSLTADGGTYELEPAAPPPAGPPAPPGV